MQYWVIYYEQALLFDGELEVAGSDETPHALTDRISCSVGLRH